MTRDSGREAIEGALLAAQAQARRSAIAESDARTRAEASEVAARDLVGLFARALERAVPGAARAAIELVDDATRDRVASLHRRCADGEALSRILVELPPDTRQAVQSLLGERREAEVPTHATSRYSIPRE